MEKNRELAGTRWGSNVIEEIVPAAYKGRVEMLLLDPRSEVFGRFDDETNAVEFVAERNPENDLIEAAVMQTLLSRGTVYPVSQEELPSARRLRAVFRYQES